MRTLIERLIAEYLEEHQDQFLINLSISTANDITVVIDADQGIKVQDCINLSRHIEGVLDEKEYEFSLKVTSCGATDSIVHRRQYNKNIGREMAIETVDAAHYEAVLTQANEEGIDIEWTQREPKKIGKGKVTVEKKLSIAYDKIKEAKTIIKFK